MYDLNVPIGTWMVSMKVNNDDVWKKVKAGEVKGFSIEGYFADKLERPNEPIKDEMKEPCEAGYEMIGTKIKNGKKVPNCVPIKQSKMSKEEVAEAKIEELKQLFSTQKVELRNVAEDIIKGRSNLDQGEIFDALLPLNNLAQKVENNLLKLEQKIDADSKELKLFEKKVKDLGIDLNKDISIAENVIKDNYKRTQNARKIARKAQENLN